MDLWEGYCKWSDTFTAFMETLPHNDCIQNIINHMQILHECKDSCDEHFTQRCSCHQNQTVCQNMQNDYHSIEDDMAE